VLRRFYSLSLYERGWLLLALVVAVAIIASIVIALF
jgi:hypothetical protein